MKKELRARVKYTNDDKREGYAVEIFDLLDGWGLDSFFPLVRRENANEDEERNFVHFSIINKIAELQRLGYEVTFL